MRTEYKNLHSNITEPIIMYALIMKYNIEWDIYKSN